MARVESLFSKTVKELSLAERVNISHGPYFEGDHLEIKFRFGLILPQLFFNPVKRSKSFPKLRPLRA